MNTTFQKTDRDPHQNVSEVVADGLHSLPEQKRIACRQAKHAKTRVTQQSSIYGQATLHRLATKMSPNNDSSATLDQLFFWLQSTSEKSFKLRFSKLSPSCYCRSPLPSLPRRPSTACNAVGLTNEEELGKFLHVQINKLRLPSHYLNSLLRDHIHHQTIKCNLMQVTIKRLN